MIMVLKPQRLSIRDFRKGIMKKFYINVFSFLVLMVMLLAGFDYLSMRDDTRMLIAEWTDSTAFVSENNVTDEIKNYIYKAQTEDGTTKLIVGDSVCRQLFAGLQEANEDFTIIGSNGAITVAGQYILMKEYLEHHPEATDVFLIILPESLERTYDTTWGYQYGVMPFVETNTLRWLDENTLNIISSTYGEFFLNPQVVNRIRLSGINKKIYLNLLRKRSAGYRLTDYFELANQYICKMDELCKERNVNFHLYPCPVSESKKEDMEELIPQFMESEIYPINPSFFEQIYYFPAEQAADGAHFSGDYANQECYNDIISVAFDGDELLEMLGFELL